MEKKSFLLSLVTVILGMIALFSDYWVTGPYWHAGFIKACGPFNICLNYLKALSDLDETVDTLSSFSPRLGKRVSKFASFAKNLDVYYVCSVILMIYLPLMTIFFATILKGISWRQGPSKLRDVTATVCTWIATYHGFGLMIFFIVMGVIKNNMKMVANEDSEEIDTGDQQVKMPVSFGWSAYIGLLTLLFALAAAITSCPLCNKADGNDIEETDEPLFLDNMA